MEKPVVISFDEFVEHGKASGANIVNGMPWSFEYMGHPVTHENDDLYIVGTEQFRRGSFMVTYRAGRIVFFRD